MSDILEYKCPCCGGAVTFDARAQKIKCPYCDTEFDPDTLRQFEEEEIEEDSVPDWKTVGKGRTALSPMSVSRAAGRSWRTGQWLLQGVPTATIRLLS